MQEEEEEAEKDTGEGGGGVQEEEGHAGAGDMQEEEEQVEKDAGAGGGEATDFGGQQHFEVTGERVDGLQSLASGWVAEADEWVRGLRVGDELEVYLYKSTDTDELYLHKSTNTDEAMRLRSIMKAVKMSRQITTGRR